MLKEILTPIQTHPLKGLLNEHRISHAQVAHAVGVSRPYLSAILNGYARPSKELGEKLDQLTLELERQKSLIERLK